MMRANQRPGPRVGMLRISGRISIWFINSVLNHIMAVCGQLLWNSRGPVPAPTSVDPAAASVQPTSRYSTELWRRM